MRLKNRVQKGIFFKFVMTWVPREGFLGVSSKTDSCMRKSASQDYPKSAPATCLISLPFQIWSIKVVVCRAKLV